MQRELPHELARKQGRNVTGIYIPDLHCPYTRDDYWAWVLGRVADLRPDFVVQLGDWLDVEFTDRFPNEGTHDGGDEYAIAARQAAELGGVLKKRCPRFLHEGNHEWRINPANPAIPAKLRRLVHWENYDNPNDEHSLRAEWRKWRRVPYTKERRGVLEIGQVASWHGYRTGGTAKTLEPVEMLQMSVGMDWTLGISGHTHSLHQPYRLKRTETVQMNAWAANPGTGGELKPDFVQKSNTSSWAGGLAVVHLRLDEPSALGGRSWDCEVEAFDNVKGYSDEWREMRREARREVQRSGLGVRR